MAILLRALGILHGEQNYYITLSRDLFSVTLPML